MRRFIREIIFAFVLILVLPFIIIGSVFGDNTDWSKPTTADTYTAWPGYVKDLARTAGKMDYTGDTNIPTGMIRYNTSTNQLEKYNGSTWDPQLLNNIKDGAVSTTAKIGSGVVTSTNILDATIATGDIAANTIVAGNIANSTITGAKIAGTTITGSNIASSTIDNSKLSIAPTSCTCTLTGGGSQVVSSVSTTNCKYQRVGGFTSFTMTCAFTASVAASSLINVQLPTTPANTNYTFFCGAMTLTGFGSYVTGSSDNATVAFSGSITEGTRILRCSGVYE